MKRALIRPDQCANCDECAVARQCPIQAAFRETPRERPWVNFYRCSGCLKCKTFCPNRAIEEITQPCTGGRRMGW